MAHFFQLQQLEQESPPAARWQLHMRPISVITGHSWISRLAFSECDTRPSTKALHYHMIHALLMRSGSSFQMVNYSFHTAQVNIFTIHKEKRHLANMIVWSYLGIKWKIHLTSKQCFGLISFFFWCFWDQLLFFFCSMFISISHMSRAFSCRFHGKLINMIQKKRVGCKRWSPHFVPAYAFVPLYCSKLFNWVSLIVRRYRKEHRPLLASTQATMQYQIQFPSKRQAAVEPTAAPEINEDLHQGKALVWDGRFLPNKRPLHQEQRGPWKAAGCSERLK